MRPILAAAVVAVALAAPATAASPPTKSAGRLTVGLAMPSAGFQVGAVRGRTVVLAKGLEIDLAPGAAATSSVRSTKSPDAGALLRRTAKVSNRPLR